MAVLENQLYLLLLNAPLDTIEGVQEVANLKHQPVHVEDRQIIQAHFAEDCRDEHAALLDATAAAAVEAWAQRHQAVYRLNMVPISAIEAQRAEQAAQKIQWPCWMFVYGDLADTNELAKALGIPGLQIRMRPGRLLGYQVHELDGSPRVVPTVGSSNALSTRLRPAQDALSRLRHDPSIDEADYQVVYEDRFDGQIVLDLALWKTDVSDEEFIPMHRILQFRRKWDGVVIWDRALRIDLLFGNGVRDCVEGQAVEIPSAEQALKLHAMAPNATRALPCMLDFTDAEGGTTRAWTFR